MSSVHPISPGDRWWVSVLIATIGAVASVAVAYFSSRPVARSAASDEVKKAVAEEAARWWELPIGTVVASILPPKHFREATQEANLWVPCEGQAVDSKEYTALTERAVVPDLRGLFLRGLSAFTAGTPLQTAELIDTSDPQGHRTPGMGQTDTMGLYLGEKLMNRIRFLRYHGGDGNTFHALETVAPADANLRSGQETAPRNAAVYYYCKIR